MLCYGPLVSELGGQSAYGAPNPVTGGPVPVWPPAQGRGDGPKASTSWASEAARVKAELDCVTLWVCFAYMPKHIGK